MCLTDFYVTLLISLMDNIVIRSIFYILKSIIQYIIILYYLTEKRTKMRVMLYILCFTTLSGEWEVVLHVNSEYRMKG